MQNDDSPAPESALDPLIDRSHRWCLFLDLDGTLIDFALAPELVSAPAELVPLLQRLSRAFAGALAIVSGRPLGDVDRLLAPLRLPAAGLHGVERRDAEGRIWRCPVNTAAVGTARHAMRALADRFAGAIFEDKGDAVALHYRVNPAIGPGMVRCVYSIAEELGPAVHVQEGAFVCEIKPAAANKRTAVESFLAEPPFQGRRPIFIGDDLTDRDAFDAVNRQGGLAIAVGAPYASCWRLPNPGAVRRWLTRIADMEAP